MTLQELLGIELPIIQAPMAGVQGSALAIAVCNAGGLGSLPCVMLDAKTLRKELETICAHTTRPYNVNFFCHAPPVTGAIAPLRAKAESKGSGDFSPLWCGQNASGCREVPAAQLTRELKRH